MQGARVALGAALLAMVLGGLPWSAGPALAATATVCNTTSIVVDIPPAPESVIRRAFPYPSAISVSGLGGTITDVDVQLKGISHPYPEDLDVVLIAPNGTALLIMSDVGGNNDMPHQVNNVDLTLSDEAAGPIMINTFLATGTYRPTDDDTDPPDILNDTDTFYAPGPAAPPNGALSVFDGLAATGTWNLYVVDDEPGPPTPAPMGILGGWCITVTTNAAVTRAVVADFDGNKTSDISVFRPSSGEWLVRNQPSVFHGISTDIPVPCDYNGDGKVDAAVFRPSVGGWYINGQPTAFHGLDTDVPVPGDYDGDGDCDIAVFRPSVGGWYVMSGATTFLGLSGDIPVPGDYDGNGTTDVAIFRSSVGGWYRAGDTQFFGLSTDVPVPGDYNGNGSTDIAVFRPSVGGWYVMGGATTFLGLSGDVPVPGDYDGNGSIDNAVYRPSSGAWFLPGQPAIFFGAPGDIPLPLPQAIYRARFTP